MAGVKGRSGGPRPNSGGARPGAGRPKKPPEVVAVGATDDPAVFLRAVMNDPLADVKVRADAAKALLPFVHAKKGEVAAGKKEQAAEAARKVAGKFSSAAPPKLAAVGGKKVG